MGGGIGSHPGSHEPSFCSFRFVAHLMVIKLTQFPRCIAVVLYNPLYIPFPGV